MDALTEREIAQIATEQREAGVRRLSRHFSWSEFCDERRRFHEEFVYDAAMFAAARGFPWSDVIRVAVMARDVFPQLDGVDVPTLLLDALLRRLPNLTSVHRREFTHFLSNTCVSRRRLFQAAVGGATDVSVTQLHLDVQLPPAPLPLEQGAGLRERERRRRRDELASELRRKEETLRRLRERSKVVIGDVPRLDKNKEGVLAAVRAAVKATEGHMLESLKQEVSLLDDITQLRLQQAALDTRGRHSPVISNTSMDG